MKRLAFILFAFTALGALAQGSVNKDMAKLVSSAINRGVEADGVYCIDNSKNKLITVEQAEQYLRDKGYFPAVSTSKTIIKFGQEQTVVDRVKFSDENGYAKFVFDKLKGGNYRYVNYSQLKTGGTFFYTVRVNRGLLRAKYKYSEFADNNRIVNVSWSGNMVDELPDGKGVGMYKITTPERIEYVVFEGEFVTGIPTTQLTVKKIDNSTFTLGGYKIYNGDEEDKIRRELVLSSYNKASSPLLKKALGLCINHFLNDDYNKDAAAVKDEYNNILVLNNPEFKTIRLINVTHEIAREEELARRQGKFVMTVNLGNDEYEYRLYKNHQNDRSEHVKLKKNDGLIKRFIKKYEENGLDPLNMLPRAKEILEAYSVLEVYTNLTFYHIKSYRVNNQFDRNAAQRDIDSYLEALDIVKKKYQSRDASFRAFYSKIHAFFIQKENYMRNEHMINAYKSYMKEVDDYYAEMCDKCKIDGSRSTVPTGYVPKEEGLFTSTPAHSEKNGNIHIVNGDNVSWGYEYDANNKRVYIIKTSDFRIGKTYFDSKGAMMDAIIEACKKKYCE